MSTNVDPTRFTDQFFFMQPTFGDSVDDYCMTIDGLTAGRVMKKSLAVQRVAWLWTITGPSLPPELCPGHGPCETLEEATAAVGAKFWAWHAWALKQPSVNWYV